MKIHQSLPYPLLPTVFVLVLILFFPSISSARFVLDQSSTTGAYTALQRIALGLGLSINGGFVVTIKPGYALLAPLLRNCPGCVVVDMEKGTAITSQANANLPVINGMAIAQYLNKLTHPIQMMQVKSSGSRVLYLV
ncbi:hypothetical protein [Mucilaginibacter paludis]|nr:hypothetical protein [Mucilaginibacter paludis]